MTESLPSELIQKNAMEQVPVLEFTDSRTGEVIQLSQSLPIIEFIDEITKGDSTSGLIPGDALLRARVRQVCYYFTYVIVVSFVLVVDK